MKPEYNEKVIMMQAMAPAVYASETEDHPYIRAMGLYFNVSKILKEFKMLTRRAQNTSVDRLRTSLVLNGPRTKQGHIDDRMVSLF